MTDLKAQQCEICRVGAPLVSEDEAKTLLLQIPDWEIVELDNIKRLSRTYNFKNFADALEFTNRVGGLAEAENHHPAILTEWGRVNVSWWTHKIKGMHKNDFIAAAKTDELYR